MMGTIAEIAIPTRDTRAAHHAIDAAIEELRAVERHLTRFRSDSDVGRANLARTGSAVPIDGQTAAALRDATYWAEVTGGAFDPCLARAILMWDVGARREPPRASTVRRFAGRELYRHLELEGRDGSWSVRLHHPDAGIDLGGIGKGIGVDRAVTRLRERGWKDALVNVGGDLFALGRSDDGDAWKIGVRSPADPRRLATTLEVADEAVATSGDYVQYFEHGGRRYHHLLDPQTGEPRSSSWRSVTVAAATCGAADAAATAVFARGPERSQLLAEWAPGARIDHII
jgi:thiamine biosynthesis lipoprotein